MEIRMSCSRGFRRKVTSDSLWPLAMMIEVTLAGSKVTSMYSFVASAVPAFQAVFALPSRTLSATKLGLSGSPTTDEAVAPVSTSGTDATGGTETAGASETEGAV